MQIELFSDKYKVHTLTNKNIDERSEERRVGKEC